MLKTTKPVPDDARVLQWLQDDGLDGESDGTDSLFDPESSPPGYEMEEISFAPSFPSMMEVDEAGQEDQESTVRAKTASKRPPMNKRLQRLIRQAKESTPANISRSSQRRQNEHSKIHSEWEKERQTFDRARFRPQPATRVLGCANQTNPAPQDLVGFEPSLEEILDQRAADAAKAGQPETSRKVIMRRKVHLRVRRYLPLLSGPNVSESVRSSRGITRGIELYTKPTDLCCFWCTEPVNGVPFPLALKYNETRPSPPRLCPQAFNPDPTCRRPAPKPTPHEAPTWWFTVHGIFCCPACALAAAKEKNDQTLTTTRFMFKRVYGYPMSTPLVPAPPKEVLIKFGGHLTTKQFRDTCAAQTATHEVFEPPLVPSAIGVQEVERVETQFAQVLDEETIKRILAKGLQNERTVSNPTSIVTSLSITKTQPRKRSQPRNKHRPRTHPARPQASSSSSASSQKRQPKQAPPGQSLSELLTESKERLELERKKISGVLGKRKQGLTLMNFMKKKA
jgi:hypothetical protein